MSRNHPNNIYDRQQNKRALAKKERAKAKHFGISASQEETGPEVVTWESISEGINFEDKVKGVVVETKGGVFDVLCKNDIVSCRLDKKIPFQLARRLVVWDKVYIQMENGEGLIIGRADRENWIARMRRDSTKFSVYQQNEQIVAVNIDIWVIVATTINPLFHANFIDRYLIIMQNGWVKPLICLNKCDLTDERSPILEYYQKELNIDVVEVSATTGYGIDKLRAVLKDKMAVLVWNSWVGKTTIINALHGQADKLRTQEVSKKHKEWRHTTTTSTLYTWDDNSHIIDTPWIRSLEVDHISRDELKYFFPEFEDYSWKCKYNDCVHEHEPLASCAVKSAVEKWEINKSRYDSYIRMLWDLV